MWRRQCATQTQTHKLSLLPFHVALQMWKAHGTKDFLSLSIKHVRNRSLPINMPLYLEIILCRGQRSLSIILAVSQPVFSSTNVSAMPTTEPTFLTILSSQPASLPSASTQHITAQKRTLAITDWQNREQSFLQTLKDPSLLKRQSLPCSLQCCNINRPVYFIFTQPTLKQICCLYFLTVFISISHFYLQHPNFLVMGIVDKRQEHQNLNRYEGSSFTTDLARSHRFCKFIIRLWHFPLGFRETFYSSSVFMIAIRIMKTMACVV